MTVFDEKCEFEEVMAMIAERCSLYENEGLASCEVSESIIRENDRVLSKDHTLIVESAAPDRICKLSGVKNTHVTG